MEFSLMEKAESMLYQGIYLRRVVWRPAVMCFRFIFSCYFFIALFRPSVRSMRVKSIRKRRRRKRWMRPPVGWIMFIAFITTTATIHSYFRDGAAWRARGTSWKSSARREMIKTMTRHIKLQQIAVQYKNKQLKQQFYTFLTQYTSE